MEPSQLDFDIRALSREQLVALSLHLFGLIDTNTQATNAFIHAVAQEQHRALGDYQDAARRIEPTMQAVSDEDARRAVKEWGDALTSAVLRNSETINVLCNGWIGGLDQAMAASGDVVTGIISAKPLGRRGAAGSMRPGRTGRAAKLKHH